MGLTNLRIYTGIPPEPGEKEGLTWDKAVKISDSVISSEWKKRDRGFHIGYDYLR